ncbi:UNVERIFIED_CONTAM: hypothetical protein Slati_2905700 [Sesamum latifolium]|uniref:Myb/SANT-like domain-containing protein n=1 Tax=Sesamum latifolium TaxID=2727402 RepID=A0AAW2VCQ4_9LAMI
MDNGPDEGSSRHRRRRGNKEMPFNQRTWTIKEEKCLIAGLKSLVVTGWKCDNGFRNGYLTQLEAHIARKFPQCDIKADPHITSKLHMDPSAKGMCYKSWSFFTVWREIFGKDRANGDSGTDAFKDANDIKDEELANKQDCYIPTTEWNPDIAFVGGEEETPSSFNVNGDPTVNSSSATKRTGSTSRKCKVRKSTSDIPKLVEMVSTFCEYANTRLGTLTRVLKNKFGDPDYRVVIMRHVRE